MAGGAGVRLRQVAATEEISTVEAVPAMAETMSVVLMAAAAATTVRRNGQDGLVGRHGAALRRQNPRAGLGTIWCTVEGREVMLRQK